MALGLGWLARLRNHNQSNEFFGEVERLRAEVGKLRAELEERERALKGLEAELEGLKRSAECRGALLRLANSIFAEFGIPLRFDVERGLLTFSRVISNAAGKVEGVAVIDYDPLGMGSYYRPWRARVVARVTRRVAGLERSESFEGEVSAETLRSLLTRLEAQLEQLAAALGILKEIKAEKVPAGGEA